MPNGDARKSEGIIDYSKGRGKTDQATLCRRWDQKDVQQIAPLSRRRGEQARYGQDIPPWLSIEQVSGEQVHPGRQRPEGEVRRDLGAIESMTGTQGQLYHTFPADAFGLTPDLGPIDNRPGAQLMDITEPFQPPLQMSGCVHGQAQEGPFRTRLEGHDTEYRRGVCPGPQCLERDALGRGAEEDPPVQLSRVADPPVPPSQRVFDARFQ